MLQWKRDRGDHTIRLLERKMEVGHILPTQGINTDRQAEWAGDRYRLRSKLSWTLTFQIEQPDTGLSASLIFHVTGKQARIRTNLGGTLSLKRVHRRRRVWQLRDGDEPLLDLFWEQQEIEGTALVKENMMTRLYLLLIVYSLDRFYARKWGGDHEI